MKEEAASKMASGIALDSKLALAVLIGIFAMGFIYQGIADPRMRRSTTIMYVTLGVLLIGVVTLIK